MIINTTYHCKSVNKLPYMKKSVYGNNNLDELNERHLNYCHRFGGLTKLELTVFLIPERTSYGNFKREIKV